MVVDIRFAGILLYLLVFVRLCGMLLFNPLLNRNGVPAMTRLGLILLLTLMLAPMQPDSAMANVYGMGAVSLVFAVFRELAIGLVFGYVFQVFYYLLFYVGDIIDTDIGLSMAKTLDPASNINSGFSTSFVTTIFSLYIFTSGSHYKLFEIFASTFSNINVGTFTLSSGILSFCIELFCMVFSLALRLAAPMMVAEFALQFSMGVLMKFIPQITVFVINYQLRIILGLLMLFMFSTYIGNFIDTYIDVLFDNLVDAAALLAASP
ncbi:flagellar biosynthetic protein FliR [Ruminococcaceae bacterium OttesenSCG-928-A11]|nr:flagellar biosynthetic protein FliR [Ruminococcaceae bacterium OttesenSCG-928-A11]